MFSQTQQALELLSAAVGAVEQAPTAELRRALELTKQLRSRVELLETKAASLVAQREQHGDGGAGLLSKFGGLSRSEAARNVRTDTELAQIPAARTGIAQGEISLANAARLAQAARKTSPQAIQDDAELVAQAKALPADEFAQAVQRWTLRHQGQEELAAQYRRNRRNRHVRFWNGDDGSVQMRGSFDTEMGARIQSRLRHEAEQLRQADRRRARHSQDGGATGAVTGGATGGEADQPIRTRDQRMADALDTLLTADSDGSEAVCDSEQHDTGRSAPALETAAPLAHVGRKTPRADIIVRADLAALTGQPSGIAEICGVGLIPVSTLERLSCNSDVWLEVFSDKLTPLYEAVASRSPTAAQRRALIARDGSCIGCGAPPSECEAHHIIPWKRGGKTRVDNLVLVCWSCHDRIHDHNWQVTVREGRFRLGPPDASHQPNPAPSRKPQRARPRPRQTGRTHQTDEHDRQGRPAA